MPPRLLTAIALTAIFWASACAEFGGVLQPTSPGLTAQAMDSETVVAGLKKALVVGTERATDRLAAEGGYLADELFRIRLPRELDSMARALRQLGLERQVENLEVAMNRAAEQAAGEAVEVFSDEISRLTFEDAIGILRGGSTAATDYFEARTSGELESRFQPVIAERLRQVGLSRLYDELAGRYNALPFVTQPAVDLESHVTQQALVGLFQALGEEEARIRADPVARTTNLLRRVFSQV